MGVSQGERIGGKGGMQEELTFEEGVEGEASQARGWEQGRGGTEREQSPEMRGSKGLLRD